jgi:membrane protein DedA with SNARE-associated domain
MMDYLFDVAGMWLLSIVKFIATPFVMLMRPDQKWSFLETILITSSGAALGSFVFYHFGEIIFNWWAHHFPKKRKKMTRMNRWIVNMKMKYGLKGILFIAGLISVPISAMVVARLYRHQATALPKLIIAFFVWSSVLTTLAWAISLTY